MSATSDSDPDDILVVDITPASSCVSCRASHNVHFIHARRGTERSTPHDVTVEVDGAARTVKLPGVDAGPQTWRNHDPGRLGDALRRSEGRAVWLPEYHLLRVPAARRAGDICSISPAPMTGFPASPGKSPTIGTPRRCRPRPASSAHLGPARTLTNGRKQSLTPSTVTGTVGDGRHDPRTVPGRPARWL